MGRLSSTAWICLLSVILGCAANPQGASAQDGPEKPTARPTPPPASAEGDEKDERKYRARITDRFQTANSKPFAVADVVIYTPEVSLFGGGEGKSVKTLELKRGAATIVVPFARIAKITVGKQAEDRLAIAVSLRGVEDPKNRVLQGTVKANLELKGIFEVNGLETTIKLRETKTIDLEASK